MKKTRTYEEYKGRHDFVEWWNKRPSVYEIEKFLQGSVARPYHFAYMIKYPNGGAPKVKIKYRERGKGWEC